MNVGVRNALRQRARVATAELCAFTMPASLLAVWPPQRASETAPSVRFELPAEVEMQECAGLNGLWDVYWARCEHALQDR